MPMFKMLLYFLATGLILSFVISNIQLQNKMYLEYNGFEVEYKTCTLKLNKLKIMDFAILIFLILFDNKNVTHYVIIFSYMLTISTYYINAINCQNKQNRLFELIMFLILGIYLQINSYIFMNYLMLWLCFSASLKVE